MARGASVLDMSVTSSFVDDLNEAVQYVPNLARVRFEMGLRDDAERWIHKKHANGAVHEPATIAAFLAVRRCYPEIRCVYDIGALFGYFSLLAGSLFEDAEVTAFEMHPGAIPSLAPNVWPGTKVVFAAIADRTEYNVRVWISAFNIYEQPEGGWEKLADESGAMKQRGQNNRGRGFADINFITLDDYCAHSGDKPGLIKIDVEGYQAKAIQGALKTIEAHRPVIILELHDPDKLARFGTTNAKTVRPLFNLGYRAFFCGNHRDADARFEEVAQMAEAHERLSIMVFTP